MRSYESAVSPLFIIVKLISLLCNSGNEATQHFEGYFCKLFCWEQGGTRMSTLQDIQRLVDEAQLANNKRTRELLIPEILKALSTCTDLEQKYRTDLSIRIPKLLDGQTLEGLHIPIDVEQIAKLLKNGELKPLKPPIEDSGVV
jgi:hypothetical protein